MQRLSFQASEFDLCTIQVLWNSDVQEKPFYVKCQWTKSLELRD
jgi:hypothetical protein